MEDFDFNDITYSKLKITEGDTLDNRIVIINIGDLDREGLALLINKTSSMGAKVIGLDVTLEGPRDPFKDSLIQDAINRNKNLILASRFHPGEGKEESVYVPNYFSQPDSKSGFVNFLSKEWATVRIWNPFLKIKQNSNSHEYQSFAAAIIGQYSASAFERLKKRNHSTEIINYSRKTNQYLVIDEATILNGNVEPGAIKDKIALLGYISSDPKKIEDKKYTPFNEELAGRSIPDMNGVVIQANIISMALDGKYITKLPLWATILIAVIIGWLHMSFFIHYYLENHIWFHLTAKIAQLISAILFVYLSMVLFSKFRIKLDMTLTLIVIVLAVDIIYFYEAFAVWLHKKFGYKTVFHQKYH